jgi:glycosyltransferase involved in cell wall biosynthesis
VTRAEAPELSRLEDSLPLRVLDIEIGEGIPELDLPEEYGGAHILLRRRGRPLAWVTLLARNRRIVPERILAALGGSGSAGAHLVLHALEPENEERFHPPISVVVCTRDRPDLLARCLRSMASLEYPTWEVIVVDNAPTSGATRVEAAAAGVRYVCERFPGLDRARNRGLAEARHEIVAFTDDDVEVDPRWLTGIARGFADPQVSAVTGMIAPAALDTEAQLLFELRYSGMGKGAAPRRWDPAILPAARVLAAHSIGVGANMAFRRQALERLGGFDTALDVGMPARGAGDLDMFHRLLAAGDVIQYEPAALVRHHHRRDRAALEAQHRDNGRAFGVYLLKVLRRGTLPRAKTVRYALRVWLPWLIGRPARRLFAREELPGHLLRAELFGALQAPWAYFATYRLDRRLRREATRSAVEP